MPARRRIGVAASILLVTVTPVAVAARLAGSPTLSVWATQANAVCAPYVRAQHTSIALSPLQQAALQRLQTGVRLQANDAMLLKNVATQIDRSAAINDSMRKALTVLRPPAAVAQSVALALSLVLRGTKIEYAAATALRKADPRYAVFIKVALGVYSQSNAVFARLGATECAK